MTKFVNENAKLRDMSPAEVRQLILVLRGHPTHCDFCTKPKPEEELHPEEGGEWICNECIKRIGYGGGTE